MVRSRRQTAVVQIKVPSKVLAQEGLDAAYKLGLGAICTQAKRSGRGFAISDPEMARFVGRTEQTIGRWMGQLVEAGLVIDPVHAAGHWFGRLPAWPGKWESIKVPEALLTWPEVSAAQRLAFAWLWRRGRYRFEVPIRFHFVELGQSLGVTQRAARRWIRGERDTRGLVGLGFAADEQIEHGVHVVRLFDPVPVIERQMEPLCRKYLGRRRL